jgi:hypothetical protein
MLLLSGAADMELTGIVPWKFPRSKAGEATNMRRKRAPAEETMPRQPRRT